MDEFVTKFVNLQCYAHYPKEEKAKVYRFISFLPLAYKEKIEFDRFISILIDSRDSLSYIATRVLEKCKLSK